MEKYYIAACVFSVQHPALSEKIQHYVSERFHLNVLRCCVPHYRTAEFEQEMPEEHRKEWASLKSGAKFQSGDIVYSICHNCLNIIEETKPGVEVYSLYELILKDENFEYPDYQGKTVAIQDCWRSRHRREEQDAVRQILKKMNMEVVELPENHEDTEFCGSTLYRAQPPRNPKIAPRFYVDGAKGKFIEHTEEEQVAIMKDYCAELPTEEVVCYCHYCLEGLLQGEAKAYHLADLLFSK